MSNETLTEVKVVYKPCDTPCPKCGSLDILRRFYKRSEKIEASDYGKPPLPRWVGGSGYTWWASRDLISHHCRCCQHDWVDGPLPKQGRQKKGSSCVEPEPCVSHIALEKAEAALRVCAQYLANLNAGNKQGFNAACIAVEAYFEVGHVSEVRND